MRGRDGIDVRGRSGERLTFLAAVAAEVAWLSTLLWMAVRGG